jgi:hypothetical protein
VLAPTFWMLLGEVMRLDGDAFIRAVAIRPGFIAAIFVVLAAGFSEALGQSIVLFANRVKPARFVFSLFVDAFLFAFGYGFLVLSTWVVCRLPGAPNLSFRELALIFAMSYVPMLLAFLGAMPYFGAGILRVLRIWHFLAMVVGVAAVAHVDVFAAATYVWLGWLVMVLAQRSFGKPIVKVGTQLLDAVAGVRVIEDAQIAIGRAEAGSGRRAGAPHVAVTAKAPKHPRRWTAILGLAGIAILAVVVALALEPVRLVVFGWQERLPDVVQLPFDLFWLAVIAIAVAGFMAPLETLGWWAGWYGDDIDTSDLAAPARAAKDGVPEVARYIVYLDGIAQSSGKYTPDIETFLDALSPELPQNVSLIRGVMAYSVLNKPLEDDPLLSRFWKFVDWSRSKNMNSLLGLFVNLRNVTIVAVSADPRYGAMYNFGIADVIYKSLIANGYRKNGGVPVTLLGYSGGGQMACGAAAFLKRAIDAPVDVISLGGVISGNDPILDLEHLYHLVGTKDNVERLGPLMFASRWPTAPLSYWNRAKRLGSLTWISLGPVGHQVPGGLLDPGARLADGRTNLRQTLDYIESIVTDRFVAKTDLPKKSSNYARYAAAGVAAPALRPADKRYLPVADWVGRLILPARDQRFGGAFFEVWNAPASHRTLVGSTVRLRWSDDPNVRKRIRAVSRDVNFSAQAHWASAYGGLVMPVRLDRRRMVDPLESLAGAHPSDDVVVKLIGAVVANDTDPATLQIEREPVQITGAYYGLMRFCGPAPGTDDGYRAVHFDRTAGTFGGEEEVVRMPEVVPDLEGRPNSRTTGIDRSPLNDDGWYVYGAADAGGHFVVQALAPRALLRANALERDLGSAHQATHYARKTAWRDIVAGKGSVVRAGTRPWTIGERGLLVHTYGGARAKKRKKSPAWPPYFGHFAYGVAEVVNDAISGEGRFEITYYQAYAQNTDGFVAGALDWSRYLGDRQYGWAGVRPVCDAVLRHDGFDGAAGVESGAGVSALDALLLQLEVTTARYRTGDGTGGTFAGLANNCSQDSNRALFATLRALPHGRLAALSKDLRKKLQPFGAPRRDWSHNEYNLGTTMEDAPLANLISALGSWRCILPRLAFDTIAAAFVRHGASLTILATDKSGGERPDVEPVVPTTLSL